MSKTSSFSASTESAVFAKKHFHAALQEWNYVSHHLKTLQEINVSIQALLPRCAPISVDSNNVKVIALPQQSLRRHHDELAGKKEKFTQTLLTLCNHVRIQINTAQKAVELLDEVDIELEHKNQIDQDIHTIIDVTNKLQRYYGAMILDIGNASFKKYESLAVPDDDIRNYLQAIRDIDHRLKSFLQLLHSDLVILRSDIATSILQESDPRFKPSPSRWRVI